MIFPPKNSSPKGSSGVTDHSGDNNDIGIRGAPVESVPSLLLGCGEDEQMQDLYRTAEREIVLLFKDLSGETLANSQTLAQTE